NRERSKIRLRPHGSLELTRVASTLLSRLVSTFFAPSNLRLRTSTVPSSLHAPAQRARATRRTDQLFMAGGELTQSVPFRGRGRGWTIGGGCFRRLSIYGT